MTRTATIGVVVATALALAVSLDPASGHAPLVKKAKDEGFPAKNCQYCHTVSMPKKETFKPEQLNDRGKWLMAEKDKQKAADVKVEWLKDYPGGKEQK